MQTQRFYSLNNFMRQKHGEKVIKLSIDGGFTCPNRDGRVATKGCIFCSAQGSGDFTPKLKGDITRQLESAVSLLSAKWGDSKKYIAYFQSYSNTYAPVEVLKAKYEEALSFPGVVGLAIATRPDCLDDEIIEYLAELNKRTHLWVELGLQTIHEDTAKLINRAYPLSCFEEAVQKLHAHNIETVVHLILGLPHETREQMLASAKYVSKLPLQGIKLHMLHVLDNAPLGKYYLENPFPILSEEEYIQLIGDILCILPPELVIHRLTGDGPAAHLIAPLWTKNKKKVLNDLNRYLKETDIYQGKSLNTY